MTMRRKDNFNSWWSGPEMESIRKELFSENLPHRCRACQYAEDIGTKNLRQSSWEYNKDFSIDSKYPNWFQISFSNICNIGCWTCYEGCSSVIQEEKKKLKLLPADYVDPYYGFLEAWPDYKETIIKAYREHDTVLINLFGGEPSVCKEFVDFMQELVDLGLNKRTKIEMFTNCYKPKNHFQELLYNNDWNHISILASIDAVGKANNWIRYGSEWKNIESNLINFKGLANYLEIQTIVSVLSVKHLSELKKFSDDHDIPLRYNLLLDPWYLGITNWDQDPNMLVDKEDLISVGMADVWNKIGSEKREGCSQRLKTYINSLNRSTDISDFNPYLHELINNP